MNQWYRQDLAYIHDVGYGDYALQATTNLLPILAEYGIETGYIVELGCGSGLSAQILTHAGYRVLGIDISEALLAIARERVPQAEFRLESLFQADIPPCNGVISIGECVCYLFDDAVNEGSDRSPLTHLFQRVYQALLPGGLFIFDIVEPGQVEPGVKAKSFTEGEDWFVLVEKEEDLEQQILTRRIVTFRQVGAMYQRDDEIHRQRLYLATEVAEELKQVGFEIKTVRAYGRYPLPTARVAFIAYKSRIHPSQDFPLHHI